MGELWVSLALFLYRVLGFGNLERGQEIKKRPFVGRLVAIVSPSSPSLRGRCVRVEARAISLIAASPNPKPPPKPWPPARSPPEPRSWISSPPIRRRRPLLAPAPPLRLRPPRSESRWPRIGSPRGPPWRRSRTIPSPLPRPSIPSGPSHSGRRRRSNSFPPDLSLLPFSWSFLFGLENPFLWSQELRTTFLISLRRLWHCLIPPWLIESEQPVSYAQLVRSIHELAATSDQVSVNCVIIYLCLLLKLLEGGPDLWLSMLFCIEKLPEAAGAACVPKTCRVQLGWSFSCSITSHGIPISQIFCVLSSIFVDDHVAS